MWTLAVSGDCSDAGCDAEAYGFELTEFVHHCVDLLVIWSLGVENGLGVVEDYEYVLGGKKGAQRCQVLRVFDPCTNDLGEAGEEMKERSGELVAPDESTVISKPFLDPIVVEDGEGD